MEESYPQGKVNVGRGRREKNNPETATSQMIRAETESSQNVCYRRL